MRISHWVMALLLAGSPTIAGIVLLAPNGDEVGENAWISAVPYTIEWSWDGNVSDNLSLEYSLDGHGGPWVMITNGIAAGAGGSGMYTWLIPRIENPLFENLNSDVVIQIRDMNDNSISDTSDSTFEIIQDFKLRVPNGGEHWYIGDTNVIRWESSFDLPVKVSLYMAPDGSNYYANAGGFLIDFQTDNSNSSGSNTYDWVTRNDLAFLLTTNGRIRVQEPTAGAARYADESDGVFTMAGIVITCPLEEQKVVRNDPNGLDIEWTGVGGGDAVDIDISLDGGVTFETNIVSTVPNSDGNNSYNWLVSHRWTEHGACIRLRSRSDPNIVAVSEMFHILPSPPPLMSVIPPSITQTVYVGRTATEQVLQIQNAGDGMLNYSIAKDEAWIQSLTPSAGISTGEVDQVEITYLTNEMPPGSYTGAVVVSSVDATNAPITVVVTMTVLEGSGPTLAISPPALYPISPLGRNAGGQEVEVWNSGGGAMSYSVLSDANWVVPLIGNAESTGEVDSVSISYDTSALPTGTYSATISVVSADTLNSPQEVSIFLTVGDYSLVLDNEDGGAVYGESGDWNDSIADGHYYSNSRYSATGGDSAWWSALILTPGIYSVSAWWPSHPTRSMNVPYVVDSSIGISTNYVNQRDSGGDWTPLGLHFFEAGTNYRVSIICPSSGQAGADAVKFTYFSAAVWDSDSDGMPDGDELIAGTSPTNGTDVLSITELAVVSNLASTAISWPTVPNRLYSVYCHTNILTDWPASPVYQVQGDGTQKAYTNTEPGSPRYFRLGVELNP